MMKKREVVMKVYTFSSRGDKDSGSFHHYVVCANSQEQAERILRAELSPHHVIVRGLESGKILKQERKAISGLTTFLLSA